MTRNYLFLFQNLNWVTDTFIGKSYCSTGLLKYTINNPATEFIVATESGIIHQMEKASPYKSFIPAPPNNSCACNDCPHMKRNTLEKLYLCIKNDLPEVSVPMDIILKAQKPIERMLEISAKFGL